MMSEVTGVHGIGREQQRQFRQELREQKQSLQRNKEILCDITSNRLAEAVTRLEQVRERGDALGDAYRKPKDVSTQAEILRTLAGYGVEATNKLVQQQQGQGPMELVRALRLRFVHTRDPQRDGEEDPQAFCWSELAAATEHLRRPARGMHSILGALDAKPKERKAPAQRKQRQDLAPITRPDVQVTIPVENAKETDRNLETMWSIIKAQPDPLVPVAKLVCNHVSFGQTVENLFTLSFLMRDNRVGIKKVLGTGLVVWALDGKRADAANKQKQPQQFVITLHLDDWVKMRSRVAPEECLMPHREAGVGAGDAVERRGQSLGAPASLANKHRRLV